MRYCPTRGLCLMYARAYACTHPAAIRLPNGRFRLFRFLANSPAAALVYLSFPPTLNCCKSWRAHVTAVV